MKILDFWPWKWILWPKKMTARDVYFSAQGVYDFFLTLLLDRRERQIKVAWFNEQIWQQLMISKNLSIFGVKCPFAAASEMIFGAQRQIYYRVSHKTLPTFVLWISRLPWGLELSFWTFFNSPCRVDSKSILFFIIWWNLDRDIAKILRVSHLKVII